MGSSKFAESLRQCQGRWSAEQQAWAHVLACESDRPKVDYSAVLEMFTRSGLKWPKLRVGDYLLRPGGVKRGATRVGTTEGTMLRLHVRCDDLAEILADPAAAGVSHGLRTGSCAFCGLELTTPESVGNGYGPVCAEKYGLPWAGTVAAMTEKARRLTDELRQHD